MYAVEPDVIGGRDICGHPYIFSDGVGRISHKLSSAFAKDFSLNYTPSCFQVLQSAIVLTIFLVSLSWL